MIIMGNGLLNWLFLNWWVGFWTVLAGFWTVLAGFWTVLAGFYSPLIVRRTVLAS
jgi:hypothetical protein